MKEYEPFATTADVGIRIQGREYADLYRNAVKGMNLLYFGDAGEKQFSDAQSSSRPFSYSGDSCENILVNLLTEVLYLVQYENKIVLDMIVKKAEHSVLEADLITVPIPENIQLETEIKSVTYHNLNVMETVSFKTAEIIFDV